LRAQRQLLIEQREKEIGSIQGDVQARRARLQADAESRKADLERLLQREEAALKNIKDEYSNALSNSNIFTRNGIRERYEPLVQAQRTKYDELAQRLLAFSVSEEVDRLQGAGSIDVEKVTDKYSERINVLDQRIEATNLDLAQIAGVTQKDLERDRSSLNEDRKRIQAQYETAFKVLQERKMADLRNVADREAVIAKNQDEMGQLQEQITLIKTQINEKAKDNQIYRLAKMFDPDAKTVADVDIALVNLVAKVWFGSLAMVIAITGIVLALASEVVKDERHTQRQALNTRKPLLGSLRSLALAINRRTRHRPRVEIEIREVVKEVPVDRVVFRDKIQEVVQKEVIHVPIYTNDPNLLRSQDVPT
jgi:hypothetical protein